MSRFEVDEKQAPIQDFRRPTEYERSDLPLIQDAKVGWKAISIIALLIGALLFLGWQVTSLLPQ